MQLSSLRVRHYRNFVDSGDVRVQDSVTCLVGKNESGKTALLQAPSNLNPATTTSVLRFDLTNVYSRWLKKEHELAKVIAREPPISADFVLDDRRRTALDEAFGDKVVTSETVTIARTYKNVLTVGPPIPKGLSRNVERGHLPSTSAQIAQRLQASQNLIRLPVAVGSPRRSG